MVLGVAFFDTQARLAGTRKGGLGFVRCVRLETRCACVLCVFVMYPPSNVVVVFSSGSSALNDFSLSLVGGWRRGDGDEEIEEMRRWACLVRCVNRALRFPFN